ncbi:hypothetical protein HRI_003643000 [Hibiscus trionum]|uniref:Transmembrane protein n=1 Tax=Hibiscus trionum TaxID=183268 RepID=A0A9W7MDE5_HIBTR|nr:hypothetical protein HRI_003643000 [Hibiscus trionum]
MSTQPQQPQTQQPVVVYPNNVPTGQVPAPPHSHSNGSFGPVFIVLAVIIVISAIACFIGRLCNRRRINQTKPSDRNRNHDSRPEERDVEFGFDGRIPGAKPAGGEPSKGFKMPGNEDVGVPRMAEHGDPATIPRIRIPGNGDPRGRTRVHANGDPAGLRIAEPKPVDDGALKPDA